MGFKKTQYALAKKSVHYKNWEIWGTFLFPELKQEFYLRSWFKQN